MSNPVNEVVDNLANKFGEVVEAVGPVVGDVLQTMVRETANSGFAYVLIGVGLLCISGMSYYLLSRVAPHIKNKDTKDTLEMWSVFGIVITLIVGGIIILLKIDDWMAPTKTVILEMLEKST